MRERVEPLESRLDTNDDWLAPVTLMLFAIAVALWAIFLFGIDVV